MRCSLFPMIAAALHIAAWAGVALAAPARQVVSEAASQAPAPAEPMDLAGTWRFRLDPGDVGQQQRWFSQTLPQSIRLPGSLQEQGFGEEIRVDTRWTGDIIDRSYFESPRYARYRQPGNIKVPFWLQPKRHYVGPAWYQRDVIIPRGWQHKRVVLELERCHWQTTLWVDGNCLGTRDSLSTPHVYDLSGRVPPGKHTLTVRVDNRLVVNVGPNSHSVSDHTQTNWNGIVGRVRLAATDRVWLDGVQVYPDVPNRQARLRIVIKNATGKAGEAELKLRARLCDDAAPAQPPQTLKVALLAGAETPVEATCRLGPGARLWDEFQPALYEVQVSLQAHSPVAAADSRRVVFGMRNLETHGTRFVLNGRPVFFRGTLECCIFPLTGYPPTNIESWKRIIRICKSHGLNLLRFHSHCPPEAAFAAADELGFYLHVEGPSWANQGASLGRGDPLDRWLYDETDRILRTYGNHPSFLLMVYGNEPAGPGNGAAYLRKWVRYCQQKDPRRLYASASGWPLIDENQFHVTPEPRIQAWGQGLRSRINARPPETQTDYRHVVERHRVPLISHEIGQWCVYPNFDEIPKYRGALKPRNFEIFRDFLEDAGMLAQARDFLMASGKLQALCYKEEIESALRTPGFGGFELLDLHDFPGQGTALVGVLDPFWDSKPYLTPAQFRRFCNTTVLLARLPQRIFTTADTLQAGLEVSHFGPADLDHPQVLWRLVGDEGKPLASGRFQPQRIPTGSLTPVGQIAIRLDGIRAPQKLRLVAGIAQTDFENDWGLWVYPAAMPEEPPAGIVLAHALDEQILRELQHGRKVLLLIPPRQVKTSVALGFSSIFWNTAWTRRQAPHTLGILCDPQHPALAGYPTEYHTNWQWWDLIHSAATMEIDALPRHLRPLVQVVPDWFEPKRLALAFEARVAGGKLLACSMDLQTDLEHRPPARQMRASLLRYMAGPQFDPQVELSADHIRSLYRPASEQPNSPP